MSEEILEIKVRLVKTLVDWRRSGTTLVKNSEKIDELILTLSQEIKDAK